MKKYTKAIQGMFKVCQHKPKLLNILFNIQKKKIYKSTKKHATEYFFFTKSIGESF